MNEIKIDKLFEEKLTSFEVNPSSNAWEKIESGIKNNQSKSRYLWYAIAASITLVIATAVLLTKTDMTINDEALAELPGEDQTQIAQISSEPDMNIFTNSTTEGVIHEIIKAKDNQENGLVVLNLEIDNFEMAEKQDLLSPVSNVRLSIQKQDFEIVRASVRFNPSLELIPVGDLTFEVTHESGFKKAYQYAKRVKNGEESLFDLRKAKDDLFTMAKNIKLNNQSKLN